MLILLPAMTNKLMAEWQGPYHIMKRVGEVDHQIHLHNRKKNNRIYHVNMLQKWHAHDPGASAYFSDEVLEAKEGDIPVWDDGQQSTIDDANVAKRLSETQRTELKGLLEEFADVFEDKPGRTSVIEHHIGTGLAQPVWLPPYRLPHAYHDAVKKSYKRCSPLELLNHQLASGMPHCPREEKRWWQMLSLVCQPLQLALANNHAVRSRVDM